MEGDVESGVWESLLAGVGDSHKVNLISRPFRVGYSSEIQELAMSRSLAGQMVKRRAAWRATAVVPSGSGGGRSVSFVYLLEM